MTDESDEREVDEHAHREWAPPEDTGIFDLVRFFEKAFATRNLSREEIDGMARGDEVSERMVTAIRLAAAFVTWPH